MRFDTLEQWLDWQMRLHDKAIELGLERVGRVAENMGLVKIGDRVITVAGTNGKGSSVAAYETWLRHAGYSVASYTSPHLLRYNERIKRNLQPVGDAELCEAFAAVEDARADIALTYFEFGTLAALHLMQQWQPDFAILEVGLGGRLDAVNIIDADLVHITPIGIDHQAWLGNDREKIGYEKAGVMRPGIPVVVNDPDPPLSVREAVRAQAGRALYLSVDYAYSATGDDRLQWRGAGLELELDCPLPGIHQAQNLAGVVAGLSCLLPLCDYAPAQINEYFQGTRNFGRFERLSTRLPCRFYVDVGHNHDAAQALAVNLDLIRNETGRIVVLLGMLQDKQAELFVAALKSSVDAWWLLSLDGDRGLTATELNRRIEAQVRPEKLFDTAAEVLAHALSSLGNQDIMLATGSFVTVELILRELSDSDELNSYGSKH